MTHKLRSHFKKGPVSRVQESDFIFGWLHFKVSLHSEYREPLFQIIPMR